VIDARHDGGERRDSRRKSNAIERGARPAPGAADLEQLDGEGGVERELRARKVLGWPKIWELAHAFPWECSYKRLKLAQLLRQLGVFLTWPAWM
jgi:hypothetical protein